MLLTIATVFLLQLTFLKPWTGNGVVLIYGNPISNVPILPGRHFAWPSCQDNDRGDQQEIDYLQDLVKIIKITFGNEVKEMNKALANWNERLELIELNECLRQFSAPIENLENQISRQRFYEKAYFKLIRITTLLNKLLYEIDSSRTPDSYMVLYPHVETTVYKNFLSKLSSTEVYCQLHRLITNDQVRQDLLNTAENVNWHACGWRHDRTFVNFQSRELKVWKRLYLFVTNVEETLSKYIDFFNE